MTHHIATGKLGEEQGVLHLKKQGYKIVETNYRSPFGEIDCIAKSKGYLVFVEIKTRRQSVFGEPEAAVDHRKQKKMTQSAEWYLKTNRCLNVPVRFDVLSVRVNSDGTIGFRLIEDAFEAV